MTSADLQQSIQQAREIIDAAPAGSVVFFGGAGVSTESGIPDFRSAKGIFNQAYPYPPEVIVGHSFFMAHPDVFFDFYREKMIHLDAQPNACHRKLAELEARGTLRGIITQNVDGLHQAAGSQVVHELHGSIHKNYCMDCGKRYPLQVVLDAGAAKDEGSSDGVPRCECGGIIRPDVVLYEEGLDSAVLQAAVDDIRNAAVLIIGGTSRAVYPAAGLIDYFRGSHLIVVNRDPSPKDRDADICVAANIGEVFDW